MLWGLTACGNGAVVLDGAFQDEAEASAESPSTPQLFPVEPSCENLFGGPRAIEADYLAQEATLDAVRGFCQTPLHAIAGAAGQTLRLTLTHWDSPEAPVIEILDLLGNVVVEAVTLGPGETFSFVFPRTAEHFVRLTPADPESPSHGYGLALSCFDECDLAYTRYPLVLMHGAGGTDAFFDVLTYFYEVPETLADRGYAVAWPAVDPIAGVVQRASQWQAELDALEQDGAGRRFNLIAHSQGGVDARYLASTLGDDRVVSITTISTPHHGVPVADVALGLYELAGLDNWLLELALAELGNWLGVGEIAAADQLQDLTTDAMSTFNVENPDVPGVLYTSWAGHSCDWLDWECQSDWDGEIVTPFLATSHWINSLMAGPNDGMVPVDSAVWGEFLGEFPADHFDEVGQIAGVVDAFDHRQFYLDEAQRLFQEGL
jgi:triacylglycerol lipase